MKQFRHISKGVPFKTIAGLESSRLRPLSEVTEAAQHWANVVGAKAPVPVPDAASTAAAAADLVRRVETPSAKSAAKLRSAFSDPALVQNADLQAIREAIPVPLNTGDDLAAFVESATARVTLVGADSAKAETPCTHSGTCCTEVPPRWCSCSSEFSAAPVCTDSLPPLGMVFT